jgi:hypothetical protein
VFQDEQERRTMSYFLFGTAVAGKDHALSLVEARLREAANQAEISVTIRELPPVVREMLDSRPVSNGTAYMLTAEPSQDTSEDLLDPFTRLGEGAAIDGDKLDAIVAWVRAVCSSPEIAYLSLWMTEGYDDAFDEIEMDTGSLKGELGRRVREFGDIPSLRVSMKAVIPLGVP